MPKRGRNIMKSIVTTKRKGIEHFEKMKPALFQSWLQTVKEEAGGILSGYKTVMKVDGLSARFGKDEDGNVFFEGARTGPIFDDRSFSNFVLKKNFFAPQHVLQRAYHYDDMLRVFKTRRFMRVVPPGAKVICEVLYSPLATIYPDGMVFVHVKYDKTKLGSLMTILPYGVIDAYTGEPHELEVTILDDLYNESTFEIMLSSPNLKMNEIDINYFIDLSSSKDIEKVKKDLAQFLLAHDGIEGKYRLGNEIEGIVIHIDKPYKITTNEFREELKNGKFARENNIR